MLSQFHKDSRPQFSNRCLIQTFLSLQISVFRILSKLGFVPINFEFYKSSDVDDLIGAGGFQTVESENIFAGASSYFVAARKAGQ